MINTHRFTPPDDALLMAKKVDHVVHIRAEKEIADRVRLTEAYRVSQGSPKRPSTTIISVWAYQTIRREDTYPLTNASVVLSPTANILHATREMSENIWESLGEWGYVLPSDVPPPPEELLKFLNLIQERKTSHYVVRIYPPCEENLQWVFR